MVCVCIYFRAEVYGNFKQSYTFSTNCQLKRNCFVLVFLPMKHSFFSNDFCN